MFVSYAWPDRALVGGLVRELEKQGLKVRFDGHSAAAGEDLDRAIRGAIDAARACIVVLSPATDPAHPFTSREWSAILRASWQREDLWLCTLRIGRVDPPAFLRPWPSLALPEGSRDLAWATEQVVALLARLSARPSDEAMERERSIAAARIAQIQRMIRELGKEGGPMPRHEQGG